jgi:hypothetical protein
METTKMKIRGMIPLAAFAVLCAGLAPAQQMPSAARLKNEAFVIIDANAEKMGRINDAIFSYSEIGFQEFKTVALVKKTLEAAGFTVETGVAGMPTAYMAKYGSGSPVLGMMSDFDGIPAASQKPAVLAFEPIAQGAPGHGEGHNTHPPTLIGAAIALKELKDKYQLPGTIIVYGGPAEELLASRGYMVYQATDLSFTHYDDETYGYVTVHTTRDVYGLIDETNAVAGRAGEDLNGIVSVSTVTWALASATISMARSNCASTLCTSSTAAARAARKRSMSL